MSYFTNPNIPHDPDGVVLMWDLKFQKDTPDYIFNCQVRSLSHPNTLEEEEGVLICEVSISEVVLYTGAGFMNTSCQGLV